MTDRNIPSKQQVRYFTHPDTGEYLVDRRRSPETPAELPHMMASLDRIAREDARETDAQLVDRLARGGCICRVMEVYDGGHRVGCPMYRPAPKTGGRRQEGIVALSDEIERQLTGDKQ